MDDENRATPAQRRSQARRHRTLSFERINVRGPDGDTIPGVSIYVLPTPDGHLVLTSKGSVCEVYDPDGLWLCPGSAPSEFLSEEDESGNETFFPVAAKPEAAAPAEEVAPGPAPPGPAPDLLPGKKAKKKRSAKKKRGGK